MNILGNLLKLSSELNNPVNYFLNLKDNDYHVNNFIGKKISISFQGEINCIACGRKTNKSFSQGYCFPCFTTLPETDQGVIRPELNRAHEGISRNMDWSKKHDLIDHYVYLSVTSGVKVGVTRHTQIPTRWIDQGAEYAIKLAITPYRQLAGLIEVELKAYLNDKTNWRKMLSGSVNEEPDLLGLKDEYAGYLPEEYQEFISDDDEITQIIYPVLKYPAKIKSINLEKTPEFTGMLMGIKGQYLLFDDGSVFNIRKHNGFLVEIEVK
ncbi:MAG: DUF2797 domain-containing protein [Salinivirgaceae bacterium]|jgi:hypothetical protein|nr:DUF2797 domain-containing protein [Salinivirgaceae bacterium]